MESPTLIDRALAPLHWLERARGWKRLGLLAIYLFVVSVVGLLGWREASLWGLPRVVEPFEDAKLGIVSVPDADNAMILYREAARGIKPADEEVSKVEPKDWNTADWSTIDPVIRRWVEDNRAALAAWRLGTERPDSLLCQPKDMTNATDIAPILALRDLARIALLEGSRLEQAGDMEGAWRLYRGVLRSSRHAGMHGGVNPRLNGHALLVQSRSPVQGWIGDARVTPTMLGRAIADVEDCDSMTSPVSEMVLAEYLMGCRTLNEGGALARWGSEGVKGEPTWYAQYSPLAQALLFLSREPERSLRLHRLVTAGMLAQCDRPRSLRPKLFSAKYTIYDVDARTPPVVARLTPGELTTRADRSAYSMIAWDYSWALTQLDFERGILDDFRIRMAGRAFELERGRRPRTYGELLGPYLKELPSGYESDDSIGSPTNSL